MINELFKDELEDEVDCVYREDYREVDNEFVFKDDSEKTNSEEKLLSPIAENAGG